jgi:2-dehydropantoate 2-reductase
VVKIVVVGGGAIGLLVAGQLVQQNGSSVALLARASSRQALADSPLQVTWPDRAVSVPNLKVIVDPAEQTAPDLAILCVKGYDTVGALDALTALNPKLILTLQNGIGNEEILSDGLGAGRVVSGAITTSVDVRSPTQIEVTKAGGIGLARIAPETNLEPVANVLAQAGFAVRTYPSYQAMKWSKALLNMLGNATAAILDLTVADVYNDKRLVDLEKRAYREALMVMDRMGWQAVNLPRYPAALLSWAMRWLPAAVLDPILRNRVAGGRGGKEPSLLRDLRGGRGRSEGEFIYGAIARQAAAIGVPAPTNAGLWHVLGGIARGELRWEEYRGNPERLLGDIGGF